MKPTEQLKAEHHGVKLMLKILKKACEKMHGGSPAPHEHLANAAEFLTVFVDKCHHAKEEELLFPAVRAARLSGVEGPILALCDEHRRGRALAADFAATAARCKAGDHKAPAKIIAAAHAYRELMIPHIEREESVVFAAADEGLSEETQAALIEGFERIEEEKIGAGTHERFHEMLRRLQQIYVKE